MSSNSQFHQGDAGAPLRGERVLLAAFEFDFGFAHLELEVHRDLLAADEHDPVLAQRLHRLDAAGDDSARPTCSACA